MVLFEKSSWKYYKQWQYFGTKSEIRPRPGDATFGEWPNTCLLFKKGTDKVIGGASLITPSSVLTAYHKIE